MSHEEYLSRRKVICKAPFSGITINPRGYIVLCCNSTNDTIAHISEVSSLEEIYNSAEMEHVREKMEAGKISDLPACNNCAKMFINHKQSMMGIFDFYKYSENHFDEDWKNRKLNVNRPVRYLEYTCSNMCNQTCVSCGSFFSSKWRDLNKTFTKSEKDDFSKNTIHDIVRLGKSDIDKILEVLPGLDILTVKGGEPFADKNNLKILERMIDVNPQCMTEIVSNMQTISQSTFKMLEKVKPAKACFNISASIDGIGKEYDWIRGGNFEKTVANMEKYYDVTGRKVLIIPFVSMFNFFSLEKIVEYFYDKEYVRGINITNISYWPNYIKIQNLPKDIIEFQQQKYKYAFKEYPNVQFRPVLTDVDPKIGDFENLKRSFRWIEKMNEVRGFDLLEYVPELKELKEFL